MKFYGFLLSFLFVFAVHAQHQSREFDLKTNGSVIVKNYYGKVSVAADEAAGDKVSLGVESAKAIADGEIEIDNKNGRFELVVKPRNAKARIDLTLKIPLGSRVRVETGAGEVHVAGGIESAEVSTETGTISTDVPLDRVKFNFLWTASRPRYLSSAELTSEVKEKSGGRFALNGKLGEASAKKDGEKGKKGDGETEAAEESAANSSSDNQQSADDEKQKNGDKKKSKNQKSKIKNQAIELNFTTARGIVLLNVNPSEVPSNLQERPLTEAAKAIVRSGDSLLSEAVRRSSPKYFGDYLKTLPPRRLEPTLTEKQTTNNAGNSPVKQVSVKVTDINNRAVGNLKKSDFTITEAGRELEILRVETATAPFNLVLLLDVSGSVDNYVDFIRKAARNFINTMNRDDKIAVVIFNEDAKQIQTFTTNRGALSESLDTFDAGGGTALYDALGYALVDTLRPLRGERTAIVVLSDGDDNRSFLPFDSMLGSIQESGALVYPLYVPSDLIAASKSTNADSTVDPLRSRYTALTSKAETEGARLAKVSGGVYYPIKRLADLQRAYDDIVVQLRTAYTITFRSDSVTERTVENRASPRLKVKVARENSFVNVGRVTDVRGAQIKKAATKETSRLLNFPSNFLFDSSFDFPSKTGESNLKFASVSFASTGVSHAPDSAMQQPPPITGEVGEIKYKPLLTNDLRIVSSVDFDINKSPPAFVLEDGASRIAVSRWVSPKRTRSYPYERIYNTLLHPKKATIIPVLKDEGARGERDFLQFDTVSLLNLLDVYLVIGYYADAARDSSETLADQKFDAGFVAGQIKELQNFKGSATDWNLKQLREISQILEKAKTAYAEISKRTGVALHGETGVDNFAVKISKNAEEFRAYSRVKSQNAQTREFQTVQPKEALSSDTKGRVTISDEAGGVYFFTCDETRLENKIIYLIEDKHTARGKMPSASDIKDGLLKMMLYANLKNVRVGVENVASKAVLRLTSGKIEGAISSESNAGEVEIFLRTNRFGVNQKGFIDKLFQEARENNFVIRIEKAEIGV